MKGRARSNCKQVAIIVVEAILHDKRLTISWLDGLLSSQRNVGLREQSLTIKG